MAHLARFSATELGLFRVLERRIARWARQVSASGADVEPEEIRSRQAEAREQARAVVMELVSRGVLDDGAFAENRAQALARGGRSRRAVAAHLAQRGVAVPQIEAALESLLPSEGDNSELAAALMQARKRRVGPFAADATAAASDGRERQRALAALARAGFSHDVAIAALDTDRDTAERLIAALRGHL